MAIEFGIRDRAVGDDTHVVSVTGEVDLFTAPEFKQRVTTPIAAGIDNVIEQLADELSVSPEADGEFLLVRLAYAATTA